MHSVTNINTCARLYDVFIKPKLNFCFPVWGNSSETDTTCIKRIVKRALRTVLNQSEAIFSQESVKVSNVLPHRSSLLLLNVLAVHDSLFSCEQCTENTDFKRLSNNTHGFENNKLLLSKTKRKHNDYCFSVAGARAWNSLPNEVMCITSRTSPKKKVMSLILKDLQ